jgi:hypothetical protein
MAVACKPLTMQKITGIVEVGSFRFCTPGREESASGELISFSITRTRNDPTAKLQCQVHANIVSGVGSSFHTAANNLGDQIRVSAGEAGNVVTLFTGYVTGLKKRPHWQDARKIILEITAEDVFVKMRVGGKFSRRFKMQDDAFAVITGGTRRQGGQMTMLKRVPAGKSGVSFMSAGNTGGAEHSPLIKTPDPQGKSPSGSTSPSSASTGKNQTEVSLRGEPSSVYASAGSQVYWQVIDQSTGLPVNIEDSVRLSGAGCCLHMNPAPSSFSTGSQSSKTGMTIGSKEFPISAAVKDTNGFLFTVTGDYPARVTFVHPRTGGSCSLDFNIIPPHDHRDIARGGPAVGSYDIFQI